MCEVYFDILNGLGVDHECNKQTDGQTLRQQVPRFSAFERLKTYTVNQDNTV